MVITIHHYSGLLGGHEPRHAIFQILFQIYR